jgi:hypothetical protein
LNISRSCSTSSSSLSAAPCIRLGGADGSGEGTGTETGTAAAATAELAGSPECPDAEMVPPPAPSRERLSQRSEPNKLQTWRV